MRRFVRSFLVVLALLMFVMAPLALSADDGSSAVATRGAFGVCLVAGSAAVLLAFPSFANATTDATGRVHIRGEMQEFPVYAAAKIYAGRPFTIASDGTAKAFTAGDLFGGHAEDQADNTLGASGAIKVAAPKGPYVDEVAVTSLAAGDEGKVVFATYDNEFILTATGTPIGRVKKYISSGLGEVEFIPLFKPQAAVGNCTNAADVQTALNALLVCLRTAGVIKPA